MSRGGAEARRARLHSLGLAWYVRAMKLDKTIFEELGDDPAVEAAADARADDEARHGRLISHDAMTRWLKSWGTARRAPKPAPGD